MLKVLNAVVQAARPAAFASVVVLLSTLALSGCASGFQNEYSGPNGKVLLVSKQDWASFQEYLGKVGSTRDGAFAMGVTNGQSDGWASSWCEHDSCYGTNTATGAMKRCRAGGECVLFASDDRILVNYKVADE